MLRVLPPHPLGVYKYALGASVTARLAYLALFCDKSRNTKKAYSNAFEYAFFFVCLHHRLGITAGEGFDAVIILCVNHLVVGDA